MADKLELKWTTEKPDFACMFVGKWKDGSYRLHQLVWDLGEAPDDFDGDENTLHFYLAWCDADGDFWDAYEECAYSEYLVLERLKTMDETAEQEKANG